MNNKWVLLGIVAGGIYLLHRAAGASHAPPVNTVTPLPSGAAFTGNIKRTTNNRAPDFQGDANGYGVHDWAEVRTADGSITWIMISAS